MNQGVVFPMSVLRLLTCLAILITSSQAISKSDNPFDKAVIVTAGSDVQWQYGDQTATKSVKAKDGAWYHLFYDGLKLRLRVTTSADDSATDAREFNDFAVKDIKVDGKRMKVFQWCLNNQEKHSRFLQQGLTVKKDICQNIGEQGTYVMRLTKDALTSLEQGKSLLFELKPYRTAVHVKFDISDFNEANKEFKKQIDAVMAAAAAEAAKKEAESAAAAAAAVVPVAAAPAVKTRCKAEPPKGYAGLKVIEYDCDDAAAKSEATAKIDQQVASINEQRKKAAAEAERKRKEAEAARLAQEEALRKEQEALAASAAVQAELSSDITNKMLNVCKKQWADGKSRCYCEKYIEFAPSHIKPNPDCN
jgi:hypothetical protein